MYKAPDIALWQGRADPEADALRWHQVIGPWDGNSDLNNATALLGFACDEGVRRNQGRTGSRAAPAAIRRALANVAWHGNINPVDAGDIFCDSHDMETAQATLSDHITRLLRHNARPVILGGGHEIAWGSFIGLADLYKTESRNIGILNFDAHFDLRAPTPLPSSGTAFRQIADWSRDNQRQFNYMVLGISRAANTKTLFEVAKAEGVIWHEDVVCRMDNLDALNASIKRFITGLDELYVTICMDVFPTDSAPGVSAPSALGVEPILVVTLLQQLKHLCTEHEVVWRLSDIAELNPQFDLDERTARLAARLVHELAC